MYTSMVLWKKKSGEKHNETLGTHAAALHLVPGRNHQAERMALSECVELDSFVPQTCVGLLTPILARGKMDLSGHQFSNILDPPFAEFPLPTNCFYKVKGTLLHCLSICYCGQESSQELRVNESVSSKGTVLVTSTMLLSMSRSLNILFFLFVCVCVCERRQWMVLVRFAITEKSKRYNYIVDGFSGS